MFVAEEIIISVRLHIEDKCCLLFIYVVVGKCVRRRIFFGGYKMRFWGIHIFCSLFLFKPVRKPQAFFFCRDEMRVLGCCRC